MNKILIGVVVIAILAIVGFYFSSIHPQTVTGNVVSEGTSPGMKTFMITGDHLRFYIDGVENPEIIVNQGDRVKVVFQSTDGFHDFVIDEFNAATEKVGFGDGETSVEFVADKKGNFEYYCSVGKHRENGMFGNFIVN